MVKSTIDDLIIELVDTGILQFGQFKTQETIDPFRFCADYLPAYPSLLSQIAKKATHLLNNLAVDRLVAVEDSLPFGVACALETGISLAYRKHRGGFPVQNLVGSYDSGHDAVLLLSQLDRNLSLAKFIVDTRKVGLEIKAVVEIMATHKPEEVAGLTIYSIFRLEEVITQLCEADKLSVQQAAVVQEWVTNHRQGLK